MIYQTSLEKSYAQLNVFWIYGISVNMIIRNFMWNSLSDII